jgi:choline dehydrogenase-like flavoprotein
MMQTDIVITGSGVAAAALAWKILRADPEASVLILEAGTKLKMRDFAIFQNYLVTNNEPYKDYRDLGYPQRDRLGENQSVGSTEMPLDGSRLMMYGGSTVHWGGWAFRLKPEDFSLFTNTGRGIDWPFSYDTLEPFYGEAEHFIGVSGDSRDGITPRSRDYPFKAFPYTLEDGLGIQALRKLDITYSHLPIARQGVSSTISSHAPCQTTGKCKYCPFGARFVAANALDDLSSLEAHPNFSVSMETVVEEVLMVTKSHARGVLVRDRLTGRRQPIEANLVVVASGGIESPKLLQRSGTAFWQAGIGNDHGLVGRHLVTHPYFFYQATLPKNPLGLQPQMGFPTLVCRHFDSPQEQSAGKYILVNPQEFPKYRVENTVNADFAQLMQAGHSRAQIDEAVRGAVAVQWQGILEVFSESRNRVLNGSGINRMGLTDTVVDYSKAADFDARLAAIGRQVAEILPLWGQKTRPCKAYPGARTTPPAPLA